jgi:two-component system OmpR family response regulator
MPTSSSLAVFGADVLDACDEQFVARRVPTVLVVEDDALMRQSLTTALSADFRVRAAGSGAEARGLLRRVKPDAVLLDMVLPDGDGFAVLAAVEGVSPRPQVVILSALDQVTKAVKAMRLGASDYLVKPCGLDKVRGVINDALERGRSRA